MVSSRDATKSPGEPLPLQVAWSTQQALAQHRLMGRNARNKSGSRPPRVDAGVGESRAPVTLFYYMPGPGGKEEACKVTISGPDDFGSWLKTRHLFLKDSTTRKREQELVTYSDFIHAYSNLEKDEKYLFMDHPMFMDHPNDSVRECVGNIQCNLQKQASALEVRTTRAVVNDQALKDELKTQTLTPVNDGHSVKFFMVTKKGNLKERIEVDGMVMNRGDKVLVVNEAKMSPSDKDIDETLDKEWKLQGWLSAAKENPDQFATDPPIVKDNLLGTEWKVSAVMSGDNFTEEMEEKCNDIGLRVVRSNGAGYG